MNLIFPVAGEAIRFGGAFKPFLKIGDVTFIDNTITTSFKKWIDNGDIFTIYFICTETQEKEYNVTENIKKIFSFTNPQVIAIKEKTKGPYQTLRLGIQQAKISGESIVCDCDHALDVDFIFKNRKNNYDCIIPTWKIKKDEWMNWSKIVLDKDEPKMICEKERINSEDYDVKGIIGCIYFNKIEDKFKSQDKFYVSECLQDLIHFKDKIKTYTPEWADFYGDKDMLENHVNNLRKRCSIFCDIDGVLLKHHPHSSSNIEDNEIIKGFEKLQEWKKAGHKIIITTARNKKYIKETKNILDYFKIPYDEVVTSLPAGPRILINDHKPSKTFTNQANSVELIRNKGLSNVEICEFYNESDTKIKKTFEGGSFATTYLLQNNIVRKHILKSKKNQTHYEKLIRQMNDLSRFNFLWPSSAPKILSHKDTDFDFSFDMEYLDNFITLSDIKESDEQQLGINIVLEGMKQHIYSLKKEIDGISWVNNFYKNKIFNKFKKYQKDSIFDVIINSKSIKINNKEYKGLLATINHIDKHLIKPKHIRPIHGDFTLENIMFNGFKTKVIDMDSSDIFDAAELDLGKMCQSIFSKFDEWKNLDLKVEYKNNLEFSCIDNYFNLDIESKLVKHIINQWSLILNDDKSTVKDKGIFYMSMYFIRFVPFRMKISKDHGVFALLMAVIWLNKLINNEN